jgi:hypothetical protein
MVIFRWLLIFFPVTMTVVDMINFTFLVFKVKLLDYVVPMILASHHYQL